MRTILLICISLLGTLPTVYGQNPIEKDRDTFRREADRFLSAMPDGLQEQQTQAHTASHTRRHRTPHSYPGITVIFLIPLPTT